MHWDGLAIKSGDVRTLAHVFPVATGITSPYPVTITLSIFTRELGVIEKSLDYGRCGQPGGVWLEEQFPELKAFNGMFGCSIKIQSKQSHILLNASQSVIEFFNEERSVRYIPLQKAEDKLFQTSIISDPRVEYSALLLNTSQEKVVKAEVFQANERIATVHLPANSVYEANFSAKNKDKPIIATINADNPIVPYLITKSSSKILSVNSFAALRGEI